MMKKLTYLLFFISASFFAQSDPVHQSDIDRYSLSGVQSKVSPYPFISSESNIIDYPIVQTISTQSEIDNLQATLNSISSSNVDGAALLVQNGTYNIASTINMPSNVEIRGQIRGGVIFTTERRSLGGSLYAMFSFSSGRSYSGFRNIIFRYLVNGCEPYDNISNPNIDIEAVPFNSNPYTQGSPCSGIVSDDELQVTWIRMFNDATDNWVYNCEIVESGSTVLQILGDHNEVRDVLIDRAYDKSAGKAYVAFNGTDNLFINSEVYRIRHLLMSSFGNQSAYPSTYNVFYNITTDCDFNHHDGGLGYNLIERCTTDIPAWKGFGGSPYLTGSFGSGNPVQHELPGPRNRFYKNTILNNRGGATTQTNFGYRLNFPSREDLDLTLQNVIYEFDHVITNGDNLGALDLQDYQLVKISDQPEPIGGTFYPVVLSVETPTDSVEGSRVILGIID